MLPPPRRLRPAHAPRLRPLRAQRRPAVLIVGCGDIGQRFAQTFGKRFRIWGASRQPTARANLHAAGARWIGADLDLPRTCRRLAGLAHWVVHSAPPPGHGSDDPRTRHALAALPQFAKWVYLSTTGVYGDCGGARVDEARPVAPQSARAIRRVAAERLLRQRAAYGAIALSILRVPGIYAAERLPTSRLIQRTPALQSDEDVITNHIHADDLVRTIFYALCRGPNGRIIQAVDQHPMKMADYFDAVAYALNLPPPPRLPRADVQAQLSAMQWSFLSESRDLLNTRLRRELRVQLRWPTSLDFLTHLKKHATVLPRPPFNARMEG